MNDTQEESLLIEPETPGGVLRYKNPSMTEEEKKRDEDRRRIRTIMVTPDMLHDLLKLPEGWTLDWTMAIDFETNSVLLIARSQDFSPIEEACLIPRIIPYLALNADKTKLEVVKYIEQRIEIYRDTEVEYVI